MAEAKIVRMLGIETSCDETSIALLEIEGDDVRIVSHEIASQISVHQEYGGVVPEVAARLHVAETVLLLDRLFGKVSDKNSTPRYEQFNDKIDAIAVTKGPGLATALRVGIEAARTLAAASGKPLLGVNHLEGHLASAWLVPENRRIWKFPVLVLLVSGGHTELVLMRDFGVYEVVGRTRDDASGEAFDKTAKLMGLPYPGGPQIEKLAALGDNHAFDFPRPMIQDGSLDFSFSGLKTAVRNVWQGLSPVDQDKYRADLAASILQAIIDVLVVKTMKAVRLYHPRAVCIVGGVSASRPLQEYLSQAVNEDGQAIMLAPARGLHTDNGAMIAAAGYWHFLKGERHDWVSLDAEPEMDL